MGFLIACLLAWAVSAAGSLLLITVLLEVDVNLMGYKRTKSDIAVRACAVCAAAVGVFFSCCTFGGGIFEAVCCGFFFASLAAAAYSDGLTAEVYDWVYVCGFVSMAAMLAVRQPAMALFTDLFIFAAIQFFVFRRLYGASDCIAYSMCAMYLAASGYGLMGHMMLMLVSFTAFTVAQAFSRNIGKGLRLKEPKPLIPYIFGGVLAVQLFTVVFPPHVLL